MARVPGFDVSTAARGREAVGRACGPCPLPLQPAPKVTPSAVQGPAPGCTPQSAPLQLCAPQGGPRLHTRRVQRFRGQAQLLEPLLRPLRQLILRYERETGGGSGQIVQRAARRCARRCLSSWTWCPVLGTRCAHRTGAKQAQQVADPPTHSLFAGLPESSGPLLESLLGPEEEAGSGAEAGSASSASRRGQEAEADGPHEEL